MPHFQQQTAAVRAHSVSKNGVRRRPPLPLANCVGQLSTSALLISSIRVSELVPPGRAMQP